MRSTPARISAREPDSDIGQYTVRPATPEDADAIIGLQNDLGQEEDYLLVTPYDPVTGAALLRASLADAGSSSRYCVLVAERAGRIVGLLLCRNHHHPSLSGMVQLTLCVNRSFRRMGIGSSLLREAIRWARRAGARRLQLTVFAHNVPALSVYKKAGFAIEGILSGAARVGGAEHDLLVMALRL